LNRVATTFFVLALVLGGVFARFAERNQTFFGDEMWVLEFVANGHYTPHAVPQPPLFFYSAVAASRICGMSEACLRAPAELAALLLTLVPLLVWRTTRVLRPASVIVWTAILAFSSPVSFYAARVKQYPLEALGCAVIVWLFIRAREDETCWKTFAIVAAVLVATLHSPVFVVAATGIVTIRRKKLFAMHVALAAVFAAAYFGYMRPGAEVARYFGDLEQYFTVDLPAFWDGSPSFVISQTRLWLAQFLNNTRGFAIVLCVLVLAWIVSIARRRDRDLGAIAIVALLPVALVLIASAARLYPYGEVRLMIFLLPGISLAFALAVQWLVEQWMLVAAPIAVLLAMFIVHGVRDHSYNESYMHIDDLRRAYTYLTEHRKPGTPVLVREFDERPLRYYVPIPRDELVLLPIGRGAVSVSNAEYWTFLRDTDRARVLPAGAMIVEELRDGRTRLVRYRSRSQ
jgi:hypothetical protein